MNEWIDECRYICMYVRRGSRLSFSSFILFNDCSCSSIWSCLSSVWFDVFSLSTRCRYILASFPPLSLSFHLSYSFSPHLIFIHTFIRVFIYNCTLLPFLSTTTFFFLKIFRSFTSFLFFILSRIPLLVPTFLFLSISLSLSLLPHLFSFFIHLFHHMQLFSPFLTKKSRKNIPSFHPSLSLS